jgi:large repetitive protein
MSARTALSVALTALSAGAMIGLFLAQAHLALRDSLVQRRWATHGTIVYGYGNPPAPVCGNGIVEEGEVCDDGNTSNNDACLNTCVAASCGDGYVWTGVEDCDEGGVDTFACNADCTLAMCGDGYHNPASGEACDDGGESAQCNVDCTLAVCGDGIVNLTAGEECDDGNTAGGDGCSASCSVESGYWCIGEPSVCIALCGDGMLDPGEQCDDGNAVGGDGCSASCTIEAGYQCSGEPSVCTLIDDPDPDPDPVCGNGIVEEGEECDDGNAAGGDGCSAFCSIESGYWCIGEPSVCIALCGDGMLDSGEECDDGNAVGGDGCSASCTIEAGYQCSGEPSVCTLIDDSDPDPDPVCGNGIVEEGEECDDGNDSNFDGCLNNCRLARCGDGFVRTGVEQCEPPNVNGCDASCRWQGGGGVAGVYHALPSTTIPKPGTAARCGNGVVEPRHGEECDEGRSNGLSPTCSLDCKRSFCGDGVVHPESEECEPLRHSNGSFVQMTCGGKYCLPPACGIDGCVGGCRWIFLPPCVSDSRTMRSTSVRGWVAGLLSVPIPEPADAGAVDDDRPIRWMEAMIGRWITFFLQLMSP